jgi:hypothetical protein
METLKFNTMEQVQEIQRAKKLERLKDNKLMKEMNESANTFQRNKDRYKEGETKFHTCNLYNPCPICDKCQNKASHIYVRCQTCQIPMCTHKFNDRVFMIRRENFALEVGDLGKQELRELAKQYEK